MGTLSPRPHLTIVPATGYTISPSNFVVGGALSQYSTQGVRWVGGNVSNIVTSVDFEQDGVNVKAFVNIDQTATLNANSDILIDIDESPSNPVTNQISGACVNISYPTITNSTAVLVGGSGATQTIVTNGVQDTTNKVVNLFKSEGSLVSYLMGALTVTAASGHTVQGGSIDLNIPPEFDGSYSVQVSGTSAAKTFKILYTETPGSISFEPCNFGNTATVSYTILADEVVSTGGVHGVLTDTHIGFDDQETTVKIIGDPGAQYKISLKKQPSVGSDENYDFSTTTFTTSSTTDKVGTISTSGSKNHVILIPRQTNSLTEYSVVISSHNGSVLASGVPTAVGNQKITQHGQGAISVRAVTWWSTEFGSMPSALTIKRPIRFNGDSYVTKRSSTTVTNGKTNGSSSKVMLKAYNRSIKVGMVVVGSGIPAGVTIVTVKGNVMVLSTSVNLTAFTKITCKENNPNTAPFSFTITPGAGRTLAVNTSNKHVNSAWGLRDVAHNSDNVYQMANWSTGTYTGQSFTMTSIVGVMLGMEVTVPSSPNIFAGTCFVSAIVPDKNGINGAESYTIYVNKAFNNPSALPPNSLVRFKGSNNPRCRVSSVSAVQSGANVVVSGFIEAPEIKENGIVEIRIDEIINVT